MYTALEDWWIKKEKETSKTTKENVAGLNKCGGRYLNIEM